MENSSVDMENLDEQLKEAEEIVNSLEQMHDFSGIFISVQDILKQNMVLIRNIKEMEGKVDSTQDVAAAAGMVTELNNNLDQVVRLYAQYEPSDSSDSQS